MAAYQVNRCEEIKFVVGESALGFVLVAKSKKGICAVLLGDDRATPMRELKRRFPQATLVEYDAAVGALARRIIRFLESPTRELHVPLDIRGTPFQQEVWRALRAIPAGKTASYQDIANKLGRPRSARAVGQACGANLLATIIPCHRVLRNDGAISGFGWGVERKRMMLAREGVAVG